MKPALGTSFPTGDALPKLPPARPKKRKRGKVGRSYALLGSPSFFKTPVTWGDGPVARAIRAQGGERVTSPGKAARVEFPAPRSPDKGDVVEGCPTVTVGAGASPDEIALLAPSPCADEITRFIDDGDNRARDARRATIVKAMIKAR